jgi:putative ABC transport system substrate-binding protein
MKRKISVCLLAMILLTTVSSADAQPAAKVRTIGFLSQADGPSLAYEVFRQALRGLGYVEGPNISIEYRRPEDGWSSLAEKATELVRLNVDLIVTNGGISTRAVQQATKTIPIVFTTSGDPMEGGFIDSLAQPGRT